MPLALLARDARLRAQHEDVKGTMNEHVRRYAAEREPRRNLNRSSTAIWHPHASGHDGAATARLLAGPVLYGKHLNVFADTDGRATYF